MDEYQERPTHLELFILPQNLRAQQKIKHRAVVIIVNNAALRTLAFAFILALSFVCGEWRAQRLCQLCQGSGLDL